MSNRVNHKILGDVIGRRRAIRDHIVSGYAARERCNCGNHATHKVEEAVESRNLHPFTTYLCCRCFAELFGAAAAESCDEGRQNVQRAVDGVVHAPSCCAHGYNGLCPACDATQTPPQEERINDNG